MRCATPSFGGAGRGRRYALAILLPLLLAPATAATLAATALAGSGLEPSADEPLVARFENDEAALAAALASGATLLALPGQGRVALGPAPGLAARLRAEGARWVGALASLPGCVPARPWQEG